MPTDVHMWGWLNFKVVDIVIVEQLSLECGDWLPGYISTLFSALFLCDMAL